MGDKNNVIEQKKEQTLFGKLKNKFFGKEEVEKIQETNITKKIKNVNQDFVANSQNIKKDSVKEMTGMKLGKLKGDNTNFKEVFEKGELKKVFEEKIQSGDFNKINSFTNNLDIFIERNEKPEYIHDYLEILKLRKYSCPDMEFILKIREKYEKYLFGNLEKKLAGYKTENGEDAFEILKKDEKNNYCSFDIIKFLSKLKNSQTQEFLNLENIAVINLVIAGYKKQVIERRIYELTGKTTEVIDGLEKKDYNNFVKDLSNKKVKNKETVTQKKELIKLLDSKKNTDFAIKNLSSSKEIEIVIEAQKKNENIDNSELKKYIIETKEISEIRNNLLKENNLENIFIDENGKKIFLDEEIKNLFISEEELEKAILFLKNKKNKNLEEKKLLNELKNILKLLKNTKELEKKYSLDENLKQKVINNKSQVQKKLFIKDQNIDSFIKILEVSNLEEGETLTLETGKPEIPGGKKINYLIEKTNYGYEIKFGESEIKCEDLFEVKNILEIGDYFSFLGLSFLIPYLSKILYFFRKKTTFNVDLKNGINIKEKRMLQQLIFFLFDLEKQDGDFGQKDKFLEDQALKHKRYFYLIALKQDWFKLGEFRELEFKEKMGEFEKEGK